MFETMASQPLPHNRLCIDFLPFPGKLTHDLYVRIDYIGGHIKGAQNYPSHTLDATFPTLIRNLQDKQVVVFHCALSQQRGPGAALRYIREREKVLAKAKKTASAAESDEQKPVVDQTVYVLDRGFVGWQEVYGTDERLTEGYRKELWEDGYWG